MNLKAKNKALYLTVSLGWVLCFLQPGASVKVLIGLCSHPRAGPVKSLLQAHSVAGRIHLLIVVGLRVLLVFFFF
jgi:hypothetical protein